MVVVSEVVAAVPAAEEAAEVEAAAAEAAVEEVAAMAIHLQGAVRVNQTSSKQRLWQLGV